MIYATSGEITGDATIKKDTRLYLNLLPSDFNGDYTTEWNIVGDSFDNGNISIHNPSNSSVTIKYNVSTIFDLCTLEATVTNKNGTSFVVSIPITVTDDSVLMTSTSNPVVIAICYSKGWCSSPDVMYKTEANVVTDIGEAFMGTKGGISLPGREIVTFDEFEAFTGILTIPSQAFFQCNKLKSIKLPVNVQKIEGFSFGSTQLTTIHIPNNVTSVVGTAFQSTPIEYFTVGNGNINYTTKDGILTSTDGILIKYPEGRVDEVYTTDDAIVGLGASCIVGSKIRELNIGDNVVSHNSNSINGNKYLEVINIGRNFSPDKIGDHIKDNTILENINVSSEHQALSSYEGVVYNLDKTKLCKYPEGKSEFVVLDTIKSVGEQACYRTAFKVVNLPDAVEVLENSAFYFCGSIVEFNISDNSNLTTLSQSSLAGNSKLTSIKFPKSLKNIGMSAMQSCSLLGSITFNGTEAPVFTDITTSRPITSAFGSDTSFTGSSAATRVVFVPTDSTGYDSDDWMNSIFSADRNNFTLSKTL